MAVIDRISFVPVAMSFMLYSLPSSALQPVEAFAAAARAHNPDALEAQANVSQQDAQAEGALGRVLPGVSARGTYARNQYSSSITLPPSITLPGSPTAVTITPYNQWTGSATVTVPLEIGRASCRERV